MIGYSRGYSAEPLATIAWTITWTLPQLHHQLPFIALAARFSLCHSPFAIPPSQISLSTRHPLLLFVAHFLNPDYHPSTITEPNGSRPDAYSPTILFCGTTTRLLYRIFFFFHALVSICASLSFLPAAILINRTKGSTLNLWHSSTTTVNRHRSETTADLVQPL